MPRKNPRPAAKKARAKMKARMAVQANFRRKVAPLLSDYRHGDDVQLAAIAASIFKKGGA